MGQWVRAPRSVEGARIYSVSIDIVQIIVYTHTINRLT